MMNVLRLCCVFSMITLLSVGCAKAPLQLYSGPQLPGDQVAVIEDLWGGMGLAVEKIDGDSLKRSTRIGPFTDVWKARRAEVAPGEHTLEVSYSMLEIFDNRPGVYAYSYRQRLWYSSSNLTITCRLEGGNTYVVGGGQRGSTLQVWVARKLEDDKYDEVCGPTTAELEVR